MSDHHVEWDTLGEHLTIHCDAPDTALCRVRWEPVCECETLSTVEWVDGRWTHLTSSWDDDVTHVSVGHVAPEHCNLVNWLTNDDSVESNGPSGGTVWNVDTDEVVPQPAGPVTIEWDLDHYTWRYAS